MTLFDLRFASRAMWRLAVGLAVGLVLLVGSAQGASAHSDLQSTSPDDGSVVDGPVDTIEMVFSAPINLDQSRFGVLDASGAAQAVADVSIGADGMTVTIVLDPPVEQRALGVVYTVIGDDTHPRSGSISFGVDVPLYTAPTPTAVAARENPATSPVPAPVRAPDGASTGAGQSAVERVIAMQGAVRTIGYIASMLLLGGLLFYGVVSDRPPTARARIVVRGAGIATAVSGTALLLTQVAILSGGTLASMADPGAWKIVLSGTFAIGVFLRIAGALAASGPRFPRRWMMAAVATTSAFPFLGHGIARDPFWLVLPADLVHVAAVALWTGGLLMLIIELDERRPASLSAAASTPNALVLRYSQVTMVALVAASVTGILLAANTLGAFDDLTSTVYGKRLVAKLVFVGVAVALGAFSRFRVIPRIRAGSPDDPAVQKLRLVGAVELSLMAMALIMAIALINTAIRSLATSSGRSCQPRRPRRGESEPPGLRRRHCCVRLTRPETTVAEAQRRARSGDTFVKVK